MNDVFLILGSNLGNTFDNMTSAIMKIENILGEVILKSKIYRSQAWGNPDQPDFLNQVICVRTQLSPHTLLKLVLNIEKEFGRIRTDKKWIERILDIDILFFNHDIIEENDLIIPHPFIQNRRFVLIPLAEIAANFVHPKLNKTIMNLLEECSDELCVEPLKN